MQRLDKLARLPLNRHVTSRLPARIIHLVGRTEVARPCRSCANRLAAKHTLRFWNTPDLRPKFRHPNGLLDTAYQPVEKGKLS